MGSYTSAQGFEGGEMAQRVVQLLPNKPGSLGECRERDWEDVGLTSVNGEIVSERGRETVHCCSLLLTALLAA